VKLNFVASTRRACLLVALYLTTLSAALSVPGNPAVIWIRQPDGTRFQAVMKGDEHQGWMETIDGYTIIKNQHTGYFEYAARGAGGRLIPSGVVVTTTNNVERIAPNRRPPKGLRPPRNLMLEQSQYE
jgi:hypothetical protein